MEGRHLMLPLDYANLAAVALAAAGFLLAGLG